MPPRRTSRKDLIRGCAEPGPGDGLDPRLDKDPEEGPGGRKTLQLCGQVGQALSAVLAGAADDVLRDLSVASVVPARGKGRLLVTLTPSPSAAARGEGEWLDAVGRFGPLARREASAAIHRRKTPELAFRLLLG